MANPKRETAAAAAATTAKPAPKISAESTPTPTSLAPWADPPWHTTLTSPYYNTSHHKLRDYARSYINTHILPHALDWESAGGAPRAAAQAWATTGLPFADVLSAYRPAHIPGPAGIPVDELDVFHTLILADETARVPGASMTSLAGASVIGVPPIVNWGTEEQKRAWLPGLFDWSTSFCLGVTEPGGGSDVGGIRTTARRSEDGKYFVVDGAKKWITGAPWATHMTAAVRTGGEGMGGISVLVIPMAAEGVEQRRIENSGQKAGGASWVELDDVRVPVENLIGKENEGFKIIMTNFNKERFIMAVGCNRMARTCLSDSLAYARSRHTFGKPLVGNQIIRHKLADIAHRVEAHWAWLEQIAFHIQNAPRGWQDPDIAGRIALAKVQGGQTLERASREAQQIFGGAGYQRGGVGAQVEQISRDLRMMVVGGGSEEILEDLAVRQEMAVAEKKGWKL